MISNRTIQCASSTAPRSSAAADLGCPAGQRSGGGSASSDATAAGPSCRWYAGRRSSCDCPPAGTSRDGRCCRTQQWQCPTGLCISTLCVSSVSQRPQESGRPHVTFAALQAREGPCRIDAQPPGEGPPDQYQASREVGAALRRAR